MIYNDNSCWSMKDRRDGFFKLGDAHKICDMLLPNVVMLQALLKAVII